jgi:hypothetical protein
VAPAKAGSVINFARVFRKAGATAGDCGLSDTEMVAGDGDLSIEGCSRRRPRRRKYLAIEYLR